MQLTFEKSRFFYLSSFLLVYLPASFIYLKEQEVILSVGQSLRSELYDFPM